MNVIDQREKFYKKKIEARFARVINSEFKGAEPVPELTLDELEKWVEEDNRKRKSIRRKYISMAASVVIVFGAIFGMECFLMDEDNVVNADRNKAQVTQQKDSVVIKDNVEDVDENLGENVEIHTTWEAVLEAKEDHPELLIPTYIPEGYEFKELRIEDGENADKMTFHYLVENRNLVIEEVIGKGELIVNEFENEVNLDAIKIFLKDNNEWLVCIKENDAITITGDLKFSEVKHIIKCFEF